MHIGGEGEWGESDHAVGGSGVGVGGGGLALLESMRSVWAIEELAALEDGGAEADLAAAADIDAGGLPVVPPDPEFDVERFVRDARLGASQDPKALSHRELLAAAEGFEQARRFLDAGQGHVLAELDALGVTDAESGMRTGAWLARECDLPGGVANTRVRLAKDLRRDLGIVDNALTAGTIALEHARVLADAVNPRILDAFIDCCPELIALVPTMRFDRWKSEVLKLVALLDEDGPDPEPGDLSANSLRLHKDLADTWLLRGQLVGELGMSVHQIVSERADQIFRRMTADETLTADLRVPGRDTLMAIALWELVREASSGPGTVPRIELALIVNADDAQHVTDGSGHRLCDADRDRLTCDPVFRAVVINLVGAVIKMGRAARLVNRDQKRAMAHRDGGCVFPGCSNPASWTDAHHIDHWNHLGLTELENLASLCRYHHGVVHRKGWHMYITFDQWFWFVTPSGDTFWSQRHGIQHQGPIPPTPDQPDSEPPDHPDSGTPSGAPPGLTPQPV